MNQSVMSSPGPLNMSDEAINERAAARQRRRMARERERQKYNIQLDTSAVSADLVNYTHDSSAMSPFPSFASPVNQGGNQVSFNGTPERGAPARSPTPVASGAQSSTAVVTVTTPKRRIRKGVKPIRTNVALTCEILERGENGAYSSIKVVPTKHGDVLVLTKHTPRQLHVKIARSAFQNESKSSTLASFKCCLLGFLSVESSVEGASPADPPIMAREVPITKADVSRDGRSVYLELTWSSSLDHHLFPRTNEESPLVPLSLSLDLELTDVAEPVRLTKFFTAKVYASAELNPYCLYAPFVPPDLKGDVYHSLMNLHPSYTTPYKLFLCDKPDDNGFHHVAALRRRMADGNTTRDLSVSPSPGR